MEIDEAQIIDELEKAIKKPAGFWIRVGAYLIDTILLMIPTGLVIFLGNATGYIVVSAFVLLYKPLTEGLLGGTAGKLALNLRVIHESGDLLGIAGGIVRSGVFILPMLSSITIQLELFNEGISMFDVEAMTAFQAEHEFLYLANSVLSVITIISCASVLLNKQRRGFHDFIAHSQVIHHKS